ncbi:MAG: hypothetical protein IJN20_01090 [Oscillospiraceae bacterium]|nr:hypothetical protein [Oscillospiraceae bacterium]
MSKRQKDIKSKLMAAICMLLVSSIMMVSTTYAWFTLSTAPEVTGISTAVGANGNLEMALLPTNAIAYESGTYFPAVDYGITSGVGDSVEPFPDRNNTWGNLVDLGSEEEIQALYGLHKITLYPAQLNVDTWDDETTKLNPTHFASSILSTPIYGADGRVSGLESNAVTGIYSTSDKNFPKADGVWGVRAVGLASGMTDRQLAYRNARSDAATSMTKAKTDASTSLNSNGNTLANIALAHAVNADATHPKKDVDALLAIVNDLLGTAGKTGVLQHIENAYKSYIIAYAASAAGQTAGIDDVAFKAFQSAVEGAEDLAAVKTLLTNYSITLDTATAAMDKVIATKGKVVEAQNELKALSGESFTWGQITGPLTKLADTNAMQINGYAASTVKDHMNDIVSMVTGGSGVTVTIATNGGVYADVADHCGDYAASITIDEVTYGGFTLNNMKARMETETSVSPSYLQVMGTNVTNAGEPGSENSTEVKPISDTYGYILDFAFRTNAAESQLLLQTAPEDRIYSDNAEGADTMGKGSTMTFTSTTTDFTVEQMASLMNAIRVVFFEPTTNTVFATAKLDMTEGNYTTVGGNTVTANLYLYKNESSVTTFELAAAEEATHVEVPTYREKQDTEPGTHITDGAGGYREITDGETGTHVLGVPTYREKTGEETGTHKAVTTAGGANLIKDRTNAKITPLTQNIAKAVSVLVYLDGENVGNKDVAATDASSMTGTMNLQFASSANLVPMNYTPLKSQGVAYKVTVDGTEQDTKAAAGAEFTYTLADGKTVASVTVGGTALTATTDYTVDTSTGKITIPAEKVTGDIVITTTGG